MYHITLKNSATKSWLLFPNNPEKIEITLGVDHKVYDLMSQGETVVPGCRQGKRISFSSTYPKSNTNIRPWLENAIETKEVLHLTIGGTSLDRSYTFGESLDVVIDSFRYWEKGGEPNVVFFELVFREYRPFSLKAVT